jgi:hypothetical protein
MADEPELKIMDWADFLTSVPPDTGTEIANFCYKQHMVGSTPRWVSRTPDIKLHCEVCEGVRSFECTDGTTYLEGDAWKFDFLHFRCRNCRKEQKIYSVAVRQKANDAVGIAVKFGESPPFGPHTPSRVISLIGPDRDLFLKGRRAENRGLGIGAFSYYRRVVDNQKGRIISEIAKVAEKLGAKPDVLEEFKTAAKETQFSKAVEMIKHGIPQVLLIDGHNPLTLLYGALSEGLHEHTDEECLEIAQEIRVVLTELAERISVALKQEAELTQAVSRLLTRKSAKPSAS